jgi:ethanolamine ammonia-lyase small subunit
MKKLSVKNDFWQDLKKHTSARIALGRSGGSLSTAEQLKLFQAHAEARDAVNAQMEEDYLIGKIAHLDLNVLQLSTQATDRKTFLLRPDLGRQLNQASRQLLNNSKKDYDISLIVGDGLSARAIHEHVPPFLEILIPKLREKNYQIAPICLVQQARVAVSDDIGHTLNSRVAVILIGERPGLSSPSSLGIYLTYGPKPGQTDEKRNCISNVRPEGLPYPLAAEKLLYLLDEAIRRKISGVTLKDDLQLRLEK